MNRDVKSWLRRVAAKPLDGLIQTTAGALGYVVPDECQNDFERCGYCPP
ncbi:MAG: hypothetical protein AAGG38_12820 [Planctomycetota bacterium]